MNDDLVPEEQEKTYEEILALLRHSPHTSAPITSSERSQIIERVRERLPLTRSDASANNVTPILPIGQFTSRGGTQRHRRGWLIAFNSLAAVLVVGLLIGSWLLFLSHMPFHGSAIGTAGSSTRTPSTGPRASSQASGVEASLHVLVSGPYFLSELLPVDVSIINHTQKTIDLPTDISDQNLCFNPILPVQITKGADPSYTFPTLPAGCTAIGRSLYGGPQIAVKPGKTITIHQHIPVTKSGAVTLVLGETYAIPSLNPLVGHWPSMPLQVEPKVPADRMLSLQNQGTQLIIKVPVGTHPQLLYMQYISCGNYMGSSDDRNQWTPLSSMTLNQPGCPAQHPHWQYIVSAPGYPIVAGSQSS